MSLMTEKHNNKPGPKTSEFYISLLAALVGTALAFFPDGEPLTRALGAVSAALAAFGYSASRGLKKMG